MDFQPPAFSLRQTLVNDISIFDGLEPVQVAHNSDTADLDFATGQALRAITLTRVENCLFRQSANRNNGAVATIYDRKMGVQKDEFSRWDVVVEVPNLDGLTILEGDSITRLLDSTVWTVQMVDVATLGSRLRLGCSKAT